MTGQSHREWAVPGCEGEGGGRESQNSLSERTACFVIPMQLKLGVLDPEIDSLNLEMAIMGPLKKKSRLVSPNSWKSD